MYAIFQILYYKIKVNKIIFEESSMIQEYKYQSPTKERRSPRKSIFKNSPERAKHNKDTNLLFSLFSSEITRAKQDIGQQLCSCAYKGSVCGIIQQAMLRQAPLQEMKKQYQIQKAIAIPQITFQQLIKNNPQYTLPSFAQTLPIQYPRYQIYHLNNLITIIGINNLNVQQFQCLSYIHYHCKEQYITYYFYQDMRESFPNKQNFREKFQLVYAQNFQKQQVLNENFYNQGYGRNFEQFINQFYDSAGANVIPLCCYGNAMAKIYPNGIKYLIEILVNLIKNYPKEIENVLKWIRLQEYRQAHKYMANLNWNQIL